MPGAVVPLGAVDELPGVVGVVVELGAGVLGAGVMGAGAVVDGAGLGVDVVSTFLSQAVSATAITEARIKVLLIMLRLL